MPIVSWKCSHPPYAEPYDYFLRTIPSAHASSSALTETLHHFRWQHVALVVQEHNTSCWQWGREAYYTLTERGLTMSQMIVLTTVQEESVVSQLSLIQPTTKGKTISLPSEQKIVKTHHIHCTKKPLHQVTTMLLTSTNIQFPGHNHLLTTGADDLTL